MLRKVTFYERKILMPSQDDPMRLIDVISDYDLREDCFWFAFHHCVKNVCDRGFFWQVPRGRCEHDLFDLQEEQAFQIAIEAVRAAGGFDALAMDRGQGEMVRDGEIEAAVKAEREACAQVCDELGRIVTYDPPLPVDCASAIRKRISFRAE